MDVVSGKVSGWFGSLTHSVSKLAYIDPVDDDTSEYVKAEEKPAKLPSTPEETQSAESKSEESTTPQTPTAGEEDEEKTAKATTTDLLNLDEVSSMAKSFGCNLISDF